MRNLSALLIALLLPLTVRAQHARCPLRIGVSVGITGALAAIGSAVKNGIVMADAEWDKENCVEFLIEDDAFLPRNTASAVRKLIDFSGVEGLIVFGATGALAVAPLAEAKRIPMVAIAIDDKIVRGRSYVMKHWPTVRAETELIAQEVKRRGYASVAVVATMQDAMLALRDAFRETKCVPVVLEETFPPSEVDFRAFLSRLRSAAPAAVYIVLLPPQGALFARQLRDAGYRGELFAAHQLENTDEIRAAHGALTGMWYVSSPGTADAHFAERYRTLFGENFNHGALHGYDTAKMFILGRTSGDLNTHLHTLKGFNGSLGTYNATQQNDFDLPVAVKVVTAHGFELL